MADTTKAVDFDLIRQHCTTDMAKALGGRGLWRGRDKIRL